MKILLVSMPSIHFSRWTNQLKGSGHEVHWFDILNGGRNHELDWVTQHTNWRYKFGDFKGRFLLKKYLPAVHKLLEHNVEKEFERILAEVKPDVVHSFVMYKCCVPIFPVMRRYSSIKWIYSSWGSDLYHFRNILKHRRDLERVLPHIDYLFTDNKRDFGIAKDLGFNGTFLGDFPGGGGFKIDELEPCVTPHEKRNAIVVKGYQGRSGRAITVLKALLQIHEELQNYKVVIFAAGDDVVTFLKTKKVPANWEIQSKIPHLELLKLMGTASIYIGNSASDGMPNTLLEAMIMGAFPIQSNPGGVTEEIITHGENGFLISNAEDSDEIKAHILEAIANKDLLLKAFSYNQKLKRTLDFNFIKTQVLQCYKKVEQEARQ